MEIVSGKLKREKSYNMKKNLKNIMRVPAELQARKRTRRIKAVYFVNILVIFRYIELYVVKATI